MKENLSPKGLETLKQVNLAARKLLEEAEPVSQQQEETATTGGEAESGEEEDDELAEKDEEEEEDEEWIVKRADEFPEASEAPEVKG